MKLKALKAAFPHTIPILAGFGFLGMAYGIYMSVSGFPFYLSTIMSVVVFGGSLQFVAVEMLLSPFAPLSVFIMSLLVQARHIFYGISMLDKLKGLGWKKAYIIFGMCDETFSINCTAKIPDGVDKGWFMFFVTLLDHSYWVIGSTVGAVVGSVLTFDTDGISFVMTAMFVVIFIEQWLKDTDHTASYIGLGASVVSLVIFGADSFLIPAMLAIIALLTISKKPIQLREERK